MFTKLGQKFGGKFGPTFQKIGALPRGGPKKKLGRMRPKKKLGRMRPKKKIGARAPEKKIGAHRPAMGALAAALPAPGGLPAPAVRWLYQLVGCRRLAQLSKFVQPAQARQRLWLWGRSFRTCLERLN